MTRWRECPRCNRIFEAADADQRFCTSSHARQYEHQQRLTPEDARVKELLRAIEAEIRKWIKD